MHLKLEYWFNLITAYTAYDLFQVKVIKKMLLSWYCLILTKVFLGLYRNIGVHVNVVTDSLQPSNHCATAPAEL